MDLPDISLDDVFIPESELVERLSISSDDGKLNYNMFANLVHYPIGDEEFGKYKGFYLTFDILREKLGFEKGEKPGDFDILLIPYSENEIYFHRTCAIEVKIVRPRRNNPKKAPNSYGITQVKGLIRDGFPLAGLIHICMPEPLLDGEKTTIKYYPTPLNLDFPMSNHSVMENGINLKYNHFAQFSVENQMRKLLSKDLPKYVGLNTIGVNCSKKDGRLVVWFNHDFNLHFCSAYFNPYKKRETIEKIEKFFRNNSSEFRVGEL